MNKIIIAFASLFLLNSCSKEESNTSTTPETPGTPQTPAIILPKKIEQDGKVYLYEYDGNKIKGYKNANNAQEEYQYTYTGDFITNFTRKQNSIDLQGFEYNFTYSPNNFQTLSSYKYSFFTNSYSTIYTAAFQNNFISIDIINKSNTSAMTSPYDANLLSPPNYTIDNNLQITKEVTVRKNMPEFSLNPQATVTITKRFEYDVNDTHKKPFSNVLGMNKLSFYDPILAAKYNVTNITTTFSIFVPNEGTKDIISVVRYTYVYDDAGYPTQITASPDKGNQTLTKVTY